MHWFLCCSVAILILLANQGLVYSQDPSNTEVQSSEVKEPRKTREAKSRKKKPSVSKETTSKKKVKGVDSSAKTAKPKEEQVKGGRTVGTTADGKTIYEGPRGGHFYYNDKGKKVYVKKK